jgi:hypothetical protein
MGGILKQSTAAHILFGPFVDKTNGVDLEVGAGIIASIDHATTGIFLSKNGAAGAVRHASVTASVLDAYGMFQVHLDATDTDTVGRLRVMMAEAATFLPVYDDFLVLPANVYDSLMGTDELNVQAAGADAAVLAAIAAAMLVYRKNVAPPPIHFFMYADTSPYAPATGKSVTATRSIDGAAYAAGGLSAVTEIGNGEYSVQPAQADFNGDVIGLHFTATGCRATALVFNTK